MAGAVNDFEQLFQIFARRFLTGEGAEEDGQLRHELFVLEQVIRDAPALPKAASNGLLLLG